MGIQVTHQGKGRLDVRVSDGKQFEQYWFSMRWDGKKAKPSLPNYFKAN